MENAGCPPRELPAAGSTGLGRETPGDRTMGEIFRSLPILVSHQPPSPQDGSSPWLRDTEGCFHPPAPPGPSRQGCSQPIHRFPEPGPLLSHSAEALSKPAGGGHESAPRSTSPGAAALGHGESLQERIYGQQEGSHALQPARLEACRAAFRKEMPTARPVRLPPSERAEQPWPEHDSLGG